MGDGTSIINVGELAKPATVLIEKISDAIGGAFKPYQIKRVAEAEADAQKIRAAAQIEVTELQRRALRRFFAEEAKKQSNIESITRKALDEVDEEAQPQNMENDWLANFFDKCRLISDEQMQDLWARILAGEANQPGKYSKRTIDSLSSLERSDAVLFSRLCGYAWVIGNIVPLVYDVDDHIYNSSGINFDSLRYMDDIGLISFQGIGEFSRRGLPQMITASYYGTPIEIRFRKESDNRLRLGKVLLSRIGQELAQVCEPSPVEGFLGMVHKA